MIDRDHQQLSLVRQCILLDVSRASVYYRPVPTRAEDLELMALMDRQYLKTPFYGSRKMKAWLLQQGYLVRVQVSMDGKGRYLDNIFVERLWRSIKYEEVYLKAYQTVAEARTGINAYLEFYNRQRPHQALGYRTPAEVYQHGQEEGGAAAEEAGLPSGLVKPSAGVGDSLNLALVLS